MIKEKLDEYLEFDSNLLFNRTPIEEHSIMLKRLVRVFGGAIRDIIAGQKINDVDILVAPQSGGLVEFTLKEAGYTYIESLVPKDLASVYSDIQVISEPRTWMKGTKIVQVIRPRLNSNQPKEYEQMFIDLIQNVDISSCGVSWDGENLYENYPNAITNCQNLSFYINRSAKMYSSKRASHREWKLLERGWTKIERDNTAISRDQRIESILSDKPPIDYISELPKGVYDGSWKKELDSDDLFPF